MKKSFAAAAAALLLISSPQTSSATHTLVLGDANLDGIVTAADALLVQRHVINQVKLEGESLIAADINQTGRISNIDAMEILRTSIHLLPVNTIQIEDIDSASDTDTETESGSETDTFTDTDENTDTETDTDTAQNTDTDTDTDSGSTDTIDTPDTPDIPDTPDTPDTPDIPASDTDTDTDNDTDTQSETDTDSDTDIQSDSESDNDTQSDTDNNAHSDNDTDSETDNDTDTADYSDNMGIPYSMTLNCGDRVYLEPDYNGHCSFYADGARAADDKSCSVLEVYRSGMIKGYRKGTSVVTVEASNGEKAYCTVTVKHYMTESVIHVGDHELKVTKKMMTKNDCYNETDEFEYLNGLMVHSTAEPGKNAAYWYDKWNRPGTSAAVHAFLDDEGVYQYLPYEQEGWHAGGSANSTYLDFEICEPAGFYYDENWEIQDYNVKEQQAYFDKIWENSTVYAAYLCYISDLDADDVVSHREGWQMGIATKHKDPDHWFKKHNKTMDDFRRDVEELLKENIYITDETIIKELS